VCLVVEVDEDACVVLLGACVLTVVFGVMVVVS